jgi:hypothetical protein
MLLGYSRDVLKKAIESIDSGLLTIDEFTNVTYFSHEDHFYSMDEYVIDYHGSVRLKEDCFYCEGHGEHFFSEEEEEVTVYERRSSMQCSRNYVDEGSYYLYRDEWYDDEALEINDLCWVEDLGRVGGIYDNYYHEGDGYYSYAESSDDDYLRDYHSGSYKTYTFNGTKKHYIGFEIEKEDNNVLTCVDIGQFEDETDNYWRKEKDSSLNDDEGYELISPTFEFDIPKIFKLIESNDLLVQHINARYSTNCGGHIHLSENGISGEELFDKIKGYTPLLYALYHGRVDRDFCKGKKNDDLKSDDSKYQAIKIHYNRVEFRIISAVPNVKTLKWRCKLIETIIKNPTDDPIKAYYNVDTKFTKLLKEVYSDERLVELKNRFIKYTKQFEDLTINT